MHFVPEREAGASPVTKPAGSITPAAAPLTINSARRVVVVRSPNNPNLHQGPVDLTELQKDNPSQTTSVFADGVSSYYSYSVDSQRTWLCCSNDRSISSDDRLHGPNERDILASNSFSLLLHLRFITQKHPSAARCHFRTSTISFAGCS